MMGGLVRWLTFLFGSDDLGQFALGFVLDLDQGGP